jgi:hypothetical protein
VTYVTCIVAVNIGGKIIEKIVFENIRLERKENG